MRSLCGKYDLSEVSQVCRSLSFLANMDNNLCDHYVPRKSHSSLLLMTNNFTTWQFVTQTDVHLIVFIAGSTTQESICFCFARFVGPVVILVSRQTRLVALIVASASVTLITQTEDA